MRCIEMTAAKEAGMSLSAINRNMRCIEIG